MSTSVLTGPTPPPARRRLRQRRQPGLSRVPRHPGRSARSTPARSASARSRSPTTSRTSPARRSRPVRRTSGATSRCSRCRADIAGSPNMEPGFTRLVKADNLAPRARHRSLWVKDDSGNPTHSFKDRVVAVALSAARELGIKVFACPSTGNLANAVAAAGARAGIEDRRVHPARPGAAQGHHHRRVRRHAGRREGHLRRRQPARLRDRRRGGGLGVRQRQRPALLRRGLQDARLRGRRAARLAAARAGRDPGRVRLAAHQGRQGLHRAGRSSGSSRSRRTRSSVRRPRAARRWRRRSRPATTSSAR